MKHFNREKLAPFIGIMVMVSVLAAFNAQYIAAQFAYWSSVPMSDISTSKGIGDNSNTGNGSTDVERNASRPVKVAPDPKVVVPKLNLDAPIIYGMNKVDEASVQRSLQDGVLHFGGTPVPGEGGNAVFVGHSSNAPWAPGKYKFVFSTLDRMETEDLFYLHYEGIRYEYKVTKKSVVLPNEVSVLAPTEKPSVTLITCTPVGTNLKRLVILGQQVSPEPSHTSGDANADMPTSVPVLPGNS